MEKLYDILNHLLKNEYDLNGMLYILERLEQSYDELEEIELKYQISVVRTYLGQVVVGIRRSIDELDEFLAVGKNEGSDRGKING